VIESSCRHLDYIMGKKTYRISVKNSHAYPGPDHNMLKLNLLICVAVQEA